MLLAGMLDMGLPSAILMQVLQDLGLSGVKLTTHRVIRDSVSATQVWIEADRSASCRSGRELLHRVASSRLAHPIKRMVRSVIRMLVRAESKAHGVSMSRVLFHQLAGADTLVTIAGFCAGLTYFNIRAVYCSPIPVSHWHQDHHGRWRSTPGPATRQLLHAFPTVKRQDRFEWVTPTAAAVLVALGTPQPAPTFYVRKIGRGVGHRLAPARSAGMLKLFLAAL